MHPALESLEERGDGDCPIKDGRFCYAPSTMPNPDLRMGTSETVSGAIVVVSYSKPRGVLSYTIVIPIISLFFSTFSIRRRRPAGKLYHQKRTFGPGMADSAVASASQPTISEISWTSDFTSFALVLLERSWLSFATRHGCLETWTLAGRVMLGNGCEEAGRKSGLNTGSVLCASSSELVDNVLELSCELQVEDRVEKELNNY